MVSKQAVKSLNQAYESVAQAKYLIERNIGITGNEDSDMDLDYLRCCLQHVLNMISIDVKYAGLHDGESEDGR